MKISEVIKMLEHEKALHGDIGVYVDMDYGEKPLEVDDNPLCVQPRHESCTKDLPERIIIYQW